MILNDHEKQIEQLIFSGLVYLPIESHDDNDTEVSNLFTQPVAKSSSDESLKPKSMFSRLSPSRSKLMRSIRRKSGGSIKHDDNDNEIDQIIEVNEAADKPEVLPPKLTGTKSDPSAALLRNNDKYLYDVPRQLSWDYRNVPPEEFFTKVKKKSITNHNEGAYENVSIQKNQS